MALLIRADGGSIDVHPSGRRRVFTLAELQGFVSGYIEALALPDGRVMYLNDDGKLKGLAVNRLATVLAAVSGRLRPGDVIVGDVLVCTRVEAGE